MTRRVTFEHDYYNYRRSCEYVSHTSHSRVISPHFNVKETGTDLQTVESAHVYLLNVKSLLK